MSKVGKNRSILKAVKRGRSEGEKLMTILDAWRKEQNPWLIIPGTSKRESRVRVRANEYWGNPKGSYHMGKGDGTESV